MTWDPGMEVLPAISPDGKTVAYASGTPVRMRVFVRPVAGGRGIALTDDTTQVQSHPRWSPDGSRVLFLERGGVVSVPATGGAETAEVPPGPERAGDLGGLGARRQADRICRGRLGLRARARGEFARHRAGVRGARLRLEPGRQVPRLLLRQRDRAHPGPAVRQRLAQPGGERAGG